MKDRDMKGVGTENMDEVAREGDGDGQTDG